MVASEASRASITQWSYFQWLHEWLPAPFFHTQAFLLFFAVVAAVYWLIPRNWNQARVWWLLVASFHFYAAWSAELAFLVLFTTVLDYSFARLMANTTRKPLRLALLLGSVSMNLGVLCYFKYKNFFLDSINEVLVKIGQDPAFSTTKILVAFGISFYTFEAISYAVDVYRGRVQAERNLPKFMLFILFFPHLLAGPIVRAKDFLWQTHRRKRWNWYRAQVGVQYFLLGVFKKLVIADRMAQLCDPVLAAPLEHSTSAVWLAVLAYSLRIYADFSGYTDMAIGLAHLLGFRLAMNFNLPYLAVNVSDFWRRWHISLSTWLRDYVFIPLGGSKHSGWITTRNLMITMLLGGLWHGAAWSYVLWGGLHGLYLVLHRIFNSWARRHDRVDQLFNSTLGTLWRVIVTFCVVSLTWVLFRPDLQGAWDVYQRLFVFSPGRPLVLSNRSLWIIVGFAFSCMILWRTGWLQRLWPRLHPTVLGTGYALCLCTAMVLAPPLGKTFIYFDF